MAEELTIADALRAGAERLRLRQDLADEARRDSDALLQIATGLGPIAMRAWPDRPLSAGERKQFDTLLAARLSAVPLQYLRGSQEFYGRQFRVTPDVLIPRPETELLVEETLRRVDRASAVRLADVGTGSGILAVTLALELPRAEVWAFDLSAPALAVARQNAQSLGASGRIHFAEGDLLAAAPEGSFDAIVSNPPYVPLADRETLHAQVRDHEPALALFGGPDGHDVYRRLIPQAWAHLRPGGWLLLETGGTVHLLREMLSGWDGVEVARDLQGLDRVLAAQRPAVL